MQIQIALGRETNAVLPAFLAVRIHQQALASRTAAIGAEAAALSQLANNVMPSPIKPNAPAPFMNVSIAAITSVQNQALAQLAQHILQIQHAWMFQTRNALGAMGINARKQPNARVALHWPLLHV